MKKRSRSSWPTWYTCITCIGLAGCLFYCILFLRQVPLSDGPAGYRVWLGWALFFALLALWGAWQDYRKRLC